MAEEAPEGRGTVLPAHVGVEFRECPECGYEDGFHSVFRPTGEADEMEWLLVCPDCSSTYDIGLTVRRERIA